VRALARSALMVSLACVDAGAAVDSGALRGDN